MPIFRADFDVKASMVLPEASEPLNLEGCSGESFYIKIKNAPALAGQHVQSLDVEVVGPCENIDQVANSFSDVLAAHLDILSFVTHSKFIIDQCRRIVDWEPYQKSRNFRASQKFDPQDPPAPNLPIESAATAQAILRSDVPDFVSRALRAFRYGIIGRQPEDQFQQFWFAIEIVAEGSKEGKKIPIPCLVCGGALHCSQCGSTPERRPVAAEAIRLLIQKIVGVDADVVYRQLNFTRNHLLHARPISVLEKELGVPLPHIVDVAGKVAWHAIVSHLPQGNYFSERDGQFCNGQLVARSHGAFVHDAETEHPADDKIPTMNISMDVRFGSK